MAVMKNRWFNGNVGLMLFGLCAAAIPGYRLSRHEYTYYAHGFEPGWYTPLVPFLLGVFFFVYGLIGYCRKKE
jgi:hypothetical protein